AGRMITGLRSLPIFLCLAVATVPVYTAGDPAAAKIDALFRDVGTGIRPGVAVRVIRDGTIAFDGSYGYAEVDKRIPVTPDTAFRLASVSKQFAAMAILMLAEDGALKLDDPVAKYVPELAPYDGVTIRHLVLHTGGLPDYYDSIDTSDGMPTNQDAAELLGRMASPVFPPGERYEYSNPGYDMLGPVVAAAAGMPFSAFVETRIFAPLGMTGSRVYDERKPEIPNRAYGYAADGTGWAPDDYDALNVIIGSGGIYSTLNDLARWDAALYTDELVSTAMRDLAFASGTNNAGEPLDYGFGWDVGTCAGRPCVRHGGSWVGFRTHILRIPGERFTVILLSNFAEADTAAWADRIVEICFGGGDGSAPTQ
ncbi:MAG TPA: serine hydrolase domain-containing protein, partial [Woeseiaceae bacterium]|nr:serine hydrolase domain-containing protein [Woeseiaceae bacterium]